MDVILHIGAHECGVHRFGAYMRANVATFRASGVAFWGAEQLRQGLMAGLQPNDLPSLGRDRRQRAIGRVRLHLRKAEENGIARLWVGDPNLLGLARDNLTWQSLYPGAGIRLARYVGAFDGRVSDVVLGIRDPSAFWQRQLTRGLVRGAGLPSAALLERICLSQRSWRDVIADVACAVPQARLWVAPAEIFASQPDQLYKCLTATQAPGHKARAQAEINLDLDWLRAAGVLDLPGGQGRWMPFDDDQRATLREVYADDLMWLQSGADGLAWLLDDPNKNSAGITRADIDVTEGRDDDERKGQMARPGGG